MIKFDEEKDCMVFDIPGLKDFFREVKKMDEEDKKTPDKKDA